ncbi:Sorting nexin-41 [Zancudomyces culisetae]|uniref:Sorting nexin-41 n=1 Tax=Zancudomyces culisetae TaxID=1213189 RepID=A0A1R1PWT9_ZANCU|nr:Sorting nexin-41 [Zancudomyces culisetae]|eukprot:OMH85446.1 Sorting nexin-41 [Zancudomyces culisetae]
MEKMAKERQQEEQEREQAGEYGSPNHNYNGNHDEHPGWDLQQAHLAISIRSVEKIVANGSTFVTYRIEFGVKYDESCCAIEREVRKRVAIMEKMAKERQQEEQEREQAGEYGSPNHNYNGNHDEHPGWDLQQAHLAISIRSVEKIVANGSTFVTYRIEFGRYEVKRRYSEFESLRKVLCRIYPTLLVPVLPEKHTIELADGYTELGGLLNGISLEEGGDISRGIEYAGQAVDGMYTAMNQMKTDIEGEYMEYVHEYALFGTAVNQVLGYRTIKNIQLEKTIEKLKTKKGELESLLAEEKESRRENDQGKYRDDDRSEYTVGSPMVEEQTQSDIESEPEIPEEGRVISRISSEYPVASHRKSMDSVDNIDEIMSQFHLEQSAMWSEGTPRALPQQYNPSGTTYNIVAPDESVGLQTQIGMILIGNTPHQVVACIHSSTFPTLYSDTLVPQIPL